uniref:Ionotropic glutamate receptor C-terminal domain-containing protein n=1 Tax=Strigamia maritima TaxID=126957 RepID=T1JP01_STRMM
RADISSALSMTGQRSQHVKFSPTIVRIQKDVVYRKLNQHETNFAFYLLPCSIEVWLCILVISLTVILVKVLADKSPRKKHLTTCVPDFANEVFLCWPIILHGSLNKSIRFSMNLIFGIYIVFSMVIMVSYESKLTSLLSTTKSKIPFSSLEEMLKKSEFLPIIIQGNNLHGIFKNVVKVKTPEKVVEAIYNRKFGFVGSLLAIQHLIRDNCSFVVAPQYVGKYSIAIAYSKQFAYIDYFNSKLSLLKECGIFSLQLQRFYPGLGSCVEKRFNPITFGQVIGPLILITSGIILSTIISIFELIVHKFVK